VIGFYTLLALLVVLIGSSRAQAATPRAEHPRPDALRENWMTLNGLYYYDRRPKFDLARLKAITSRQAACERGEPTAPPLVARFEPQWKVLVGTVQDGPLSAPCRFVTKTPEGPWTKEGFGDKAWQSGPAPFGRDSRRTTIRTPWTTSDLYLRRTFEYDGKPFTTAALVWSYDEDSEVYVNGQKIVSVQKHVNHYEMRAVTEALGGALRKGTNTLAAHTHQTTGGQFIDLGLLVE
jgi:hypothetical protein